MEESISLRDLHGAVMTIENEEGEREPIAGFTCSDYPECEECGHIPEELAESDREDDSTENTSISSCRRASRSTFFARY